MGGRYVYERIRGNITWSVFLKEYWVYLEEVPLFFFCYSDQDRKNIIGTLELATDEEEENEH